MNPLERWCIRVRHHPALEQAPFWNDVRPLYDNVIRAFAGRRGLERIVNGTDTIRIAPEWRGIQEVYEPSVWKRFTSDVRTGDVVVDVGAFVGLYTIALAKRVGPHGSVVAFEPDPTNFAWHSPFRPLHDSRLHRADEDLRDPPRMDEGVPDHAEPRSRPD